MVLLGLLAADGLRAQLEIRTPRQNWRAGQIVELALPESAGEDGARVYQVHFDDEPIPFEVFQSASGSYLIRIRVPRAIRSGDHGIKVFVTEKIEEAAAPSVAEPSVAVPSIEGLTLKEAENRARSAGLSIVSGDFRPPAGEFTVSRIKVQNPTLGARVRRGSRIAVELSGYSIVPEIVGLPLQEATGALAARGLRIETVGLSGAPSVLSILRVASQDPPAGEEALVGTFVRIGMGVVVPELVGIKIEQVTQILQAQGLPLLIVTRAAGEGPFEAALLQHPAPGSVVAPGTPVSVTIESQPIRWSLLWPAAVLAALVAAAWGARVRGKRLALRRRYQVRAFRDLGHLRSGTPAPIWRERELRLDVRLVGALDPGQQSIAHNGPLFAEEA